MTQPSQDQVGSGATIKGTNTGLGGPYLVDVAARGMLPPGTGTSRCNWET